MALRFLRSIVVGFENVDARVQSSTAKTVKQSVCLGKAATYFSPFRSGWSCFSGNKGFKEYRNEEHYEQLDKNLTQIFLC